MLDSCLRHASVFSTCSLWATTVTVTAGSNNLANTFGRSYHTDLWWRVHFSEQFGFDQLFDAMKTGYNIMMDSLQLHVIGRVDVWAGTGDCGSAAQTQTSSPAQDGRTHIQFCTAGGWGDMMSIFLLRSTLNSVSLLTTFHAAPSKIICS